MSELKNDEIKFEAQCIVDEAKVFYYNEKVYRAIYNPEQAKSYQRLFNEIDFEPLFDEGLIRTIICTDLKVENCNLVLEHEKIEFFLDPSEMTDNMFWKAALCFIRLNKLLAKSGLILKDAHPWNLTYHKGKPLFFDFSSISGLHKITDGWITEFYTYFVFPIFLAHSKWSNLAQEYRRQHQVGFGLSLSGRKLVKKIFLNSFFKLNRYIDKPEIFFEKLEEWVINHAPRTQNGNWDEYNQSHNSDYKNPETVKQKFVYNLLKENRPNKVVDLATNKGYFAFMAENLGAKVIGFDYEPYSVDAAINSMATQNITFCQMNFLSPTPQKGWGLLLPDAFRRFHSDIGMALGLIHHVCLIQQFPVKLFCDSCTRFASKGIILEFVYPDDKHVKEWNVKIPADYNKQSIRSYFEKHFNSFEESEMITQMGIQRQFFYFYNF